MLTKQRHSWIGALVAALLLAISGATHASDWPTRSITMVLPYPPGGSIDILGRIFVQKLQDALGQTIIIENRAGAAGTLGAGVVAKAAPDGYTMLSTVDLPIVMAPALMKTPYDPVRDLVPVAGIGDGMNLLAVHPSVGVNKIGRAHV